jgi:hypothetical protein
MGIRDSLNQGSSTVKTHEATVKLRGEDVKLFFIEPTAMQLEHMNKALHFVKVGDKYDADLNQSNMISYNMALIAFTLLGDNGELEFKDKNLTKTVDKCGAFFRGADSKGDRGFSSAEVNAVAAEALKVISGADTVEDHVKN